MLIGLKEAFKRLPPCYHSLAWNALAHILTDEVIWQEPQEIWYLNTRTKRRRKAMRYIAHSQGFVIEFFIVRDRSGNEVPVLGHVYPDLIIEDVEVH